MVGNYSESTKRIWLNEIELIKNQAVDQENEKFFTDIEILMKIFRKRANLNFAVFLSKIKKSQSTQQDI